MASLTNTTTSRAKLKERIVSGRCEPLPFPVAGIELRQFVSGVGGASAFSTGTATFEPKSKLPYYTHGFSEAITILDGDAAVAVEGRTYRLTSYDCIHVPAGVPHLVGNPSAERQLLALYAFASPQPTRAFVDHGYRVEDHADTISVAVSEPDNGEDFAAIKQSVPLASLLRQYQVKLRRSGRHQYRGCRPIHRGEGREAFHANLTRTSFTVFPAALAELCWTSSRPWIGVVCVKRFLSWRPPGPSQSR